MNVSPVHVLTVELALTESTILPVSVQARSLENVVKVVLL